MTVTMVLHEAGPVTEGGRRQSCVRCGYVFYDYAGKQVAIHSPDGPNSTLGYWSEGPVTVDGNMSIAGIQEGAVRCEAEG